MATVQCSMGALSDKILLMIIAYLISLDAKSLSLCSRRLNRLSQPPLYQRLNPTSLQKCSTNYFMSVIRDT